jgi:hypothetical protein
MKCEACGREFKRAGSESRFDEQGRRVCRKSCTLWPLIFSGENLRAPVGEKWPQ